MVRAPLTYAAHPPFLPFLRSPGPLGFPGTPHPPGKPDEPWLAAALPGWLTPPVDLSLLRNQPTLWGQAVRLDPMGPEHYDGLRPLFVGDAESPLAAVLAKQVRVGLAVARERPDRADWTIVRIADHRVVGEVVLFALDADHDAMEFRIALVGRQEFDHGYGTEATRLVRDFAFGPLGLRRLSLEVGASNARARRVYDRAGFVVEGVRRQVRIVDGTWDDVVDMAMLASDPRP